MSFGDTLIAFLKFVVIVLGLMLVYYSVTRWGKRKRARGVAKERLQTNSIPPSTLDVLAQYDTRFPEFTHLLRICTKEVPMEDLLKHNEIAQAFTRLSVLSTRRKIVQQGSVVMNTSVRLSPEEVKEAKAAMTTIVRGLYDFEQLSERLGNAFNESTDKFLNSIK